MADFSTGVYDVDETGHHQCAFDFDGSLVIKNLGPEVAYIGKVNNGVSGTVDTDTAYPLAPGETVSIRNSTTADTYVPGFNTASGTARLVVLRGGE